MNIENLTTEFKREYTDDIKKTVIAFANTNGGEIRIGIADDGTVAGVKNIDTAMQQVTNAVRDTIKPDATMLLLCEPKEIEGRQIVVITVQKGTASPYYLAGKGIRPEGVFIRQGSSTVPATESAILKMIKDTGGDNFEATRSLKQELTFLQAERYFKDEKVKFGAEQKRTLGLIGSDDAFTNLGLLISDQCIHTVKLAIFEGSSKTLFKDRVEFSGSLLKQLDDIYEYINRFNRTRSEFFGLKRIDMRDYPPEAVREALLNAIVHCDYSYSSSTLISLFDDRIEFVSLGGLPKGIGYSDLQLGVSVLRNNNLANIFYRLHLIEAYGTGILKMLECYNGYIQQPKIEVSENAFKISLPNTNFTRENTPQKDELTHKDKLTHVEEKTLEYMVEHGKTARKEIEAEIGLSQATTIRLLNSLVNKQLITKTGRGKNIRYSVKKG